MISGEVFYKWSIENKAEEDPESEYEDADYEGVFLGKDFSLEESGKRSDDLFIQMYIGFIDHPVTGEEGKIILEVGLNKQGSVEWVEGPHARGNFVIIEDSLNVSGADRSDDDFDDFADDDY